MLACRRLGCQGDSAACGPAVFCTCGVSIWPCVRVAPLLWRYGGAAGEESPCVKRLTPCCVRRACEPDTAWGTERRNVDLFVGIQEACFGMLTRSEFEASEGCRMTLPQDLIHHDISLPQRYVRLHRQAGEQGVDHEAARLLHFADENVGNRWPWIVLRVPRMAARCARRA